MPVDPNPLTTAQEKKAGPTSEFLSSFNPLNMYGGGILGGLGALSTDTRSLKEQAEYDSTDNVGRAIANVLVPGMGPYNLYKRYGASIRSPEMKRLRARRQADKLRRELGALGGATQETSPPPEQNSKEKDAGWKTEAASMLNPVNLLAGYPAAALAAVTPTRTLDEQAAADEETWGNILIPGRGIYNQWKRLGAATRSPEMLRMRDEARAKKLQKLLALAEEPGDVSAKAAAVAVKFAKVYEAGESVDNMPIKNTRKSHKKCAPGEFGMNKEGAARNFGAQVKQALNPALGMAGLGGVGGALAGGLSGLIAPGEYEDEDGRMRQRSRFGSALRRALLGGAAGVGLGGAYGLYDPKSSGNVMEYLKGLMGSRKAAPTPIRTDSTSTLQAPGYTADAMPKVPSQNMAPKTPTGPGLNAGATTGANMGLGGNWPNYAQ